jgi:hypothetical protein
MPWTLGEPAWWWTDGGALLPGPRTDIGASALPPEQRAKMAPKRERH